MVFDNPFQSFMTKYASTAGMQKEALLPHFLDKALEERSPAYRKVKQKVIQGADKVVALTAREVGPEYMQAIKDHMEPRIGTPVKYHDIHVPVLSKMVHADYLEGQQGQMAQFLYGAEPGATNVWAHPTKSPGVLAHELGHATMPKKLRKPFLYVNAAGQYLTQAAQKMPEGSKGRKALMVAGQVPLLAEEARASAVGLKAIKDVHGTKEMFKSMPSLAAAYGTYLNAARKKAEVPMPNAGEAMGKLRDAAKGLRRFL